MYGFGGWNLMLGNPPGFNVALPVARPYNGGTECHQEEVKVATEDLSEFNVSEQLLIVSISMMHQSFSSNCKFQLAYTGTSFIGAAGRRAAAAFKPHQSA